jgi:serine/threonine protein kinase
LGATRAPGRPSYTADSVWGSILVGVWSLRQGMPVSLRMPLLTKALSPGEQAGRYRVQHVLHQSARSIVYMVEHAVLGVPAVLKVSLDGTSTELEAEALSLIQSPYVPALYDRGVLSEAHNQAPYFIAEHAEGDRLSDVLRAHRRLGSFAAVRMALQLLSALAEAHRQGIVHGDVKPDNVIYPSKDDAGRSMLIDFGSARGVHPPQSSVVSRAVQATPAYAAPEVRNGAVPSASSDVFSLACLLFESLSGRRPEFTSTHELRSVLSQLVPVHPTLCEVLSKALAFDVSARYENASAFARALLEPEVESVSAFVSLDGTEVRRPQETLDTVDMTKPGNEPAFAPVSFRGAAVNDTNVPLLSTGKARVWFFSQDPAIDQPVVQEAAEILRLDMEVEVLDTDAREEKREALDAQAPWVVVFGDLHALLNDPLLEETGRRGEVARVLVATHDNLDLLRSSVNASGLDGRFCVTSSADELVTIIRAAVARVRGVRLQYDALRLAVHDTQYDIKHVKQCFERIFA